MLAMWCDNRITKASTIAALLVTASCASAPAYRQADAQRTSLTVRVAGPLPSAFSRLQAAWIGAGLVIQSSDAAGGNLQSSPQPVDLVLTQTMVTYRANSVTVGDSVDIILSATERMRPTSGLEHTEQPVAMGARGPFVKVWDKIEAIAAALRR